MNPIPKRGEARDELYLLVLDAQDSGEPSAGWLLGSVGLAGGLVLLCSLCSSWMRADVVDRTAQASNPSSVLRASPAAAAARSLPVSAPDTHTRTLAVSDPP